MYSMIATQLSHMKQNLTWTSAEASDLRGLKFSLFSVIVSNYLVFSGTELRYYLNWSKKSSPVFRPMTYYPKEFLQLLRNNLGSTAVRVIILFLYVLLSSRSLVGVIYLCLTLYFSNVFFSSMLLLVLILFSPFHILSIALWSIYDIVPNYKNIWTWTTKCLKGEMRLCGVMCFDLGHVMEGDLTI